MFLNCFDAIYYLSDHKQPIKLKGYEKAVRSVPKVVDGNKARRTFRTHQLAMRLALQEDHQRVVIFEDKQFRFVPVSQEHADKWIEFVKENNWELLFLSCLPDVLYGTSDFNPKFNVSKVQATGTYAYAVNRSWMEKFTLVDFDVLGQELDFYYRYSRSSFALWPFLIQTEDTNWLQHEIVPHYYSLVTNVPAISVLFYVMLAITLMLLLVLFVCFFYAKR